MATRSPTEHHSYWGSFADAAAIAASTSGDPRLQSGDTAYAEDVASLFAYDGNTSTWQAVSINQLTGDVLAGPGAGSQAATVVGLQGNPVAAISPVDGQVLTWNGTDWVPGAPAAGGSGGGGQTYFLNQGTAGQGSVPAVGTQQLGLVAEVPLSTVTSATLPSDGTTFVTVAGFVTDLNSPDLDTIPAGIWDFNVWALGTGPSLAPNDIRFRVKVFKWNGTTATPLSTSGTASLYDPTQTVQYICSALLPQTTILTTDRIYVTLEATATANNHTITFSFGDSTPSHTHTTLPSIAGTGIVHVINGVVQSPASAVNLAGGATEITGTLPVGNGGTGSSATPTNGQIPIGNGSAYTPSTLTAGSGISITNGAGSVTVASTSTATIGGSITAQQIAFGGATANTVAGSADFTIDSVAQTVTLTGDANPVLVLQDQISASPFVTATPVTREIAVLADPMQGNDSTTINPTDISVSDTLQSGNVSAGRVGVTDTTTQNTLSLTLPGAVATLASRDGANNPFPLNLVIEELQINTNPGNAGEVLTSNGPNAAPTWQAGGGGGGITALTQDVVASGTGSVAATVQGMGGASSKTHFVIEGGAFATLQDAVNAASANDVIMVGPKSSGDWGNVTLNVIDKPLIIAALPGAGANKVVRVGSITYDLGSGSALNVNSNEVYLYGLYIQGAFAGGSAVTLTASGANRPGRLRLYGCYIINTSATGAATVTNSNGSANASLYLDGCAIAMEGSTTGHTIVQTAGYTVVRNRCEVSASAAVGATGNAINVSAGTFEIYDSYVSAARDNGSVLVITGGTTYVSASFSTLYNSSNAAGASVAFIGTAGASFGAGNASLALGTSSAATASGSSVVTGASAACVFAYGQLSFSYVSKISVVTAVAATQEAATGDLSGNYPAPTVAKIQGRAVSTTAPTPSQVLTWNGSAWAPATPTTPVTSVTATSPVTSSGGTTPVIALGTVPVAKGGTNLTATPTNGQLPIGNGTGYTLANLTAGSGISITNASGAITIANSGVLAPAGSSGQIQYNNGSAFAAAGNVTIDNNDLMLAESASPVAPASATQMKLIAQPVSAREMPTVVNSTGYAFNLAPHPGRIRYGIWQAYGNNTTPPAGEGIPAPTPIGTTTTAKSVASTGLVASMRRLYQFTTTSANVNCGWRNAALYFMRGSIANQGGFHLINRFVISDTGPITQGTNGVYMFVGLSGTVTAPNSGTASALTNIIGVGCDASDANLSIFHNDATAGATKIPLGASFPAVGQETDAYELCLYAPPNGSSVSYMVTNLVSGVKASGTISTKLPSSSTLLTVLASRWNGAAGTEPSSGPGLSLVSLYIETLN